MNHCLFPFKQSYPLLIMFNLLETRITSHFASQQEVAKNSNETVNTIMSHKREKIALTN